MQQTVPIEKIRVVYNPRADFSAVEEIAQSINEIGLLMPLVVRESTTKGEFLLIDGEQRMRALKKLKVTCAPVMVLTLDDQKAKEATMIANLMRSDLSLIEKARGFAWLLVNAPAKYNEKTISNKYGVKEKDVKYLVKMAKNIDPKCDALIGTGSVNMDDINMLMQIPQVHQLVVLTEAVKRGDDGNRIEDALGTKAMQMDFEDVFGVSQHIASGKAFQLKYESGYSAVYTFDKELFEKLKTEADAKRAAGKKTPAEKTEDRKEKSATTLAKEADERKKERERDEKKKDALYAEMKACLPKFLSKKVKADLVEKLSGEYLNRISQDECKHLLRAFGHTDFKVSEMTSVDLRKMLWDKVLKVLVKDEMTLVNFIAFVKCQRYGSGSENDPSGSFKAWMKDMEKANG